MAIGIRPFFKLKLPSVLSDLLLDRNGYVQLPGDLPHKPATIPQSASASQPAKLGGPVTQQLLKKIAADPTQWQAALAKALSGPDRLQYLDRLQHYRTDSSVDSIAWEVAASEVGLRTIYLDDAHQTELTPGVQLFALVSNLSGLGLLALLRCSTTQTGLWLTEDNR